MSYSYSEGKLIQRSAAELLEKEPDWTAVFASPRTETVSCQN